MIAIYLIPFLLILSFCSNCLFLPTIKQLNYGTSCHKIKVASGPEDFAYDKKSSRLIISSLQRRNWVKSGDIYSLDINNYQVHKLKRVNEPKDFYLRPHGVSLVDRKALPPLLYVVSHQKPTEESKNIHFIVVYELKRDTLQFLKLYSDPLLYSPNDLFALPSGEIYVTNDMEKNDSFLEGLFKLKRGNLVLYDQNSWKEIIKGVGFANGVHVFDEHLFLSSSFEDTLYQYQVSPQKKPRFIHKYKIPGADNIQIIEGNNLLVASHPSTFSFMRHAGNPENYSPSVIHEVNPTEKKEQIIYANSGQSISAASTAQIINGKLFIGQIFNDFLLVCGDQMFDL